MAERRYVRIPPDSSGKRVLLRGSYDLPYTNKVGSFIIGDTISCSGTNSQTFVGNVVKITETTPTTGFVTLMLDQNTIDAQTAPIAGSDIIQNSTVIANVQNEGYDVFSNATTLVSYDDITKGQLVDNQGAAYTRFSEGAPQIDGFGRLKTTSTTTLGDYKFTFNRQSLLFSEILTGGGTINHSTTTGAVSLETDGLANSKAVYQTNIYHYYRTGTSQVIRTAVASSDVGKAGVVRRWGYFDENDGIYFKLDEQGFAIVVRSSTSGTVVETEVRQNEFNVDVVDGSRDEIKNKSFYNLDPSKINIYWIDGQWLGRIRVGIEGPKGRIVLHEFFEANESPVSKSRRCGLPLRFEIENVSAPGSASDLKIWNASVEEEGTLDFDHVSIPMESSSNQVTVTTSDQLLLGLRSAQTHFGIKNTVASVFKKLAVSSFDASGNPVPVEIKVYYVISPTGSIAGGTWVNADNGSLVPGYNISAVEVNKTGTFTPFGLKISEYYVNGYDNTIDVSDLTEYQKSPLIRREDGLQSEIVFVASKVSPLSPDPLVKISLTWRELG